MGKRKYHRKGQRLSIWEELDWSIRPEIAHDVIAVSLLLLGVIILLGEFSLAGAFGHFFIRIATDLWGILGYIIPFIFIGYGIVLLMPRFHVRPASVIGSVLLLIFLPALIHPLGGLIGSGIRGLFVSMVGLYASLILLFGIVLVAILVTSNTPIKDLWAKIRPAEGDAGVKVNEPRASVFATLQNRGQMTQPPLSYQPGDKVWQMPSPDLLETSSGKANSGNIAKNVEIIKKTLADFNMEVAMGEVNVGPTVTQYTMKPAPAVKLNQITARANDLALALAQHPIRIEAPIPGKAAVGLEIPNKEKAKVSLREIIEEKNFVDSKSNLSLAMGRDVAGGAIVADLKKMPHVLIAGATGSGKSVCINGMILSMLYKNSPADLRLILIDPKRVEFTHYNEIPHLLCPVVFDVDKTVSALRWAVAEMDRRFRVFQETGRRNIEAYNASPPPEGKMPYIVIIIDELADLMAQAGNEVEAAIVRIAQMARAVGIHLIVATQRPSVDVITGLIKANITNRIAFAVASQVDSRTILDNSGAEKLLGNGDMLYLGNEFGKPKRIQGVLVSDNDVDKVTNFLKSESPARYDESILEYHAGGMEKGSMGGLGSEDELYNDAKEIVVMAGKASASLLQRRLRVGYARAARLLDMLEEEGAIGPAEGAKPRDVLIDPMSLDRQRSQTHMPMNQPISQPSYRQQLPHNPPHEEPPPYQPPAYQPPAYQPPPMNDNETGEPEDINKF